MRGSERVLEERRQSPAHKMQADLEPISKTCGSRPK